MKGILKLFTSRFVQTCAGILLQFIVILLINMYFSGLFVYYYATMFVVGMFLSLIVINTRANPGYKIAWLLLLLGLPMFGVSVYILLSGRLFKKRRAKKMGMINLRVRETLKTSSRVKIGDIYAQRQSNYIKQYSFSSPYKNTKTKYFSSGEQYFESLLSDLELAEKSIYLEFFIIKPGYMWSRIKDIITRKASQGVDVKIIYDDVGCLDKLTFKEISTLKKSGIKIKGFNLFVPVLDLVLNNRDHRKIVTIDSKIAYTGGINIADEYINKVERFGYWKDSGIALYGEGAFSCEIYFLCMWEHITKEKISTTIPTFDNEYEESGIVQPYIDSPLDDELVGENVYMNIISTAKRYVYISTPYFVVDDEMLRTITNASKRGIDVRIIVPHIPDKKIVNQVTKSFYLRLIEAGVKIYEYKKGFNHSKIVVADDEIATIGSINFDYRSFYLSFENGVWLYKTDSIKDILFDYNTMLSQSIPITKEKCKVSIFTRVLRGVLSAFSPMF
ncbi:MAG: cardiolipin synthase [Clostridia bacterium]|nr:cardiolipin synthase [Clostridia bacterium]